MVRPCKTDTVRFLRTIDDTERAILLTAGQGDLTKGFQALLNIYAALHNAGFRPDDDISDWLLINKPR